MNATARSNTVGQPPEVPLKHPGLASLLAWLWPGAGHLYQGRTGKGVLFMVCILGTFFFGLAIGQGHVVYASWRPEDRRLPYLCQIGVGLPALPALVQAGLARNGREPIEIFGQKFMAPPEDIRNNVRPGEQADELSQWHTEAGANFEMGTLYTMVAGLLNILAIYDAFAGPVFTKPEEESDDPPPDENDQKDKDNPSDDENTSEPVEQASGART